MRIHILISELQEFRLCISISKDDFEIFNVDLSMSISKSKVCNLQSIQSIQQVLKTPTVRVDRYPHQLIDDISHVDLRGIEQFLWREISLGEQVEDRVAPQIEATADIDAELEELLWEGLIVDTVGSRDEFHRLDHFFHRVLVLSRDEAAKVGVRGELLHEPVDQLSFGPMLLQVRVDLGPEAGDLLRRHFGHLRVAHLLEVGARLFQFVRLDVLAVLVDVGELIRGEEVWQFVVVALGIRHFGG